MSRGNYRYDVAAIRFGNFGKKCMFLGLLG